MPFLDLTSLGLGTTPQQLYDAWLSYMQATYPDYVPGQANLENIQALAIAAIASDVAQTGAIVPDAIFRAYGTKLANVPYENGASALASVTVTATDTLGHTLAAGTSLTLGAYGFFTQSDLVIPNGSSTGTVTVVAAEAGSAYNAATNPVVLESLIDWVVSVTALAPASGGTDPEDDVDYENRLVGELRLQAPRPITASDYATMALSFPPAAGTDQQEIGRSTSIDGYLKGAASFTVTTVNASPTVTVTAAPGVGITAAAGATITGAGIPANTLVLSSTSSTITMSNNATASAAGVSATVGGTLGNERTVTTCVTLADGTATNADTKTALQAWLASFREINFNVAVIDPTYTPVYVTSSVHLYPGFDPTATAAAVQSALLTYLSPRSWGLPPFGDVAAWLQSTFVRYSKLIGVIENVSGVDYVAVGSLKLGLGATPTGVTDLLLGGPCALPTSTALTVSVPAIV